MFDLKYRVQRDQDITWAGILTNNYTKESINSGKLTYIKLFNSPSYSL